MCLTATPPSYRTISLTSKIIVAQQIKMSMWWWWCDIFTRHKSWFQNYHYAEFGSPIIQKNYCTIFVDCILYITSNHSYPDPWKMSLVILFNVFHLKVEVLSPKIREYSKFQFMLPWRSLYMFANCKRNFFLDRTN